MYIEPQIANGAKAARPCAAASVTAGFTPEQKRETSCGPSAAHRKVITVEPLSDLTVLANAKPRTCRGKTDHSSQGALAA